MITLNAAEALERLGPEVPTEPAKYPSRVTIPGRFIDLVPLESEHGDDLFPLIGQPEHERLWDYMLTYSFHGDRALFSDYIAARCQVHDNTILWAVVDKDPSQPSYQKAIGLISYLRIDATHRSIEIGNVMFSHLLKRSRKSSEVVYLMLKHAFEDLGYRRVEWKCNNLNEPSKRAAIRYGFTYEGVFRKHYVIKGRSRDTAWFAIVDDDWPSRKRALEAWLSDDNFDPASGMQVKSMTECHALQGYDVPKSLSTPTSPLV